MNGDAAIHIAQIVFIFSIIFFILLNNTMVLLVLLKWKDLNPVSSILMRSLAVSDLLVGVLLMFSFVSAIYEDWIFGSALCKITGTLTFSATAMTLYIIALSSCDRYVYIFFPLRHPNIITTHRIYVSLALFSLISFSLSASFIPHLQYIPHYYQCHVDISRSEDFFLQAIIVFLVWPLPSITVTVCCYTKVYLLARKQRRIVERQTIPSVQLSQVSKDKRNLQTVLILTLAFLFCWTPLVISTCVVIFSGDDGVNHYLEFMLLYIAYCNSFFNWFVYYFTQPFFRKGQKKLLKFPCILEQ